MRSPRLGRAQRATVAGYDVCDRIALELVQQCCERGTVSRGGDVHERKLDGREIVAHGQQVEVAHAVAGAAGRVARQRHRLDRERAHLQRLTWIEDQVGAGRAFQLRPSSAPRRTTSSAAWPLAMRSAAPRLMMAGTPGKADSPQT